MAKRATDLQQDIDTLYQLPLGEFTSARNALATRLKKEGRADEAEQIKSLQKPPVTAWTVNQLHWRDRKAMDELLAVGERFRKAQAAQLAGKATELRSLINERREVLGQLVKRAHEILSESGHAMSPDAARRITTTLEALATWGNTPGAPQPGRLSDDMDPPGFEALAALVPRPGGKKGSAEATRVLQFQQQERDRRSKQKKEATDKAALAAKARDDVRNAENALREAQRDAERAEAALKKAAAAAKAAEKEKAEIEERYEKLQAEAQATAKEARRVAQEAEAAAQAVTEAEQALERANAALEALETA